MNVTAAAMLSTTTSTANEPIGSTGLQKVETNEDNIGLDGSRSSTRDSSNNFHQASVSSASSPSSFKHVDGGGGGILKVSSTSLGTATTSPITKEKMMTTTTTKSKQQDPSKQHGLKHPRRHVHFPKTKEEGLIAQIIEIDNALLLSEEEKLPIWYSKQEIKQLRIMIQEEDLLEKVKEMVTQKLIEDSPELIGKEDFIEFKVNNIVNGGNDKIIEFMEETKNNTNDKNDKNNTKKTTKRPSYINDDKTKRRTQHDEDMVNTVRKLVYEKIVEMDIYSKEEEIDARVNMIMIMPKRRIKEFLSIPIVSTNLDNKSTGGGNSTSDESDYDTSHYIHHHRLQDEEADVVGEDEQPEDDEYGEEVEEEEDTFQYNNWLIECNDMWENVPRTIQHHLSLLGYSQGLWDNYLIPKTIKNKTWDDLSTEQQSSAMYLGCTQYTWYITINSIMNKVKEQQKVSSQSQKESQPQEEEFVEQEPQEEEEFEEDEPQTDEKPEEEEQEEDAVAFVLHKQEEEGEEQQQLEQQRQERGAVVQQEGEDPLLREAQKEDGQHGSTTDGGSGNGEDQSVDPTTSNKMQVEDVEIVQEKEDENVVVEEEQEVKEVAVIEDVGEVTGMEETAVIGSSVFAKAKAVFDQPTPTSPSRAPPPPTVTSSKQQDETKQTPLITPTRKKQIHSPILVKVITQQHEKEAIPKQQEIPSSPTTKQVKPSPIVTAISSPTTKLHVYPPPISSPLKEQKPQVHSANNEQQQKLSSPSAIKEKLVFDSVKQRVSAFANANAETALKNQVDKRHSSYSDNDHSIASPTTPRRSLVTIKKASWAYELGGNENDNQAADVTLQPIEDGHVINNSSTGSIKNNNKDNNVVEGSSTPTVKRSSSIHTQSLVNKFEHMIRSNSSRNVVASEQQDTNFIKKRDSLTPTIAIKQSPPSPDIKKDRLTPTTSPSTKGNASSNRVEDCNLDVQEKSGIQVPSSNTEGKQNEETTTDDVNTKVTTTSVDPPGDPPGNVQPKNVLQAPEEVNSVQVIGEDSPIADPLNAACCVIL